MTDLTPDERVRRVKAALAEVGRAEVTTVEFDASRDTVVVDDSIPRNPRDEITWRALAICGEAECCFDCWPVRCCDHPRMASWPGSPPSLDEIARHSRSVR